MTGGTLWDFAGELYPICRSITGDGVRETLRRIGRRIPLKIVEVPSGTRIFDWEVPREWNIRSAQLRAPDGSVVVDFAAHNLHVVSYSEPVRAQLPLSELQAHLHSDARHPQWIPYRTSYYQRNWGFCLRHAEREALPDGTYDVQIDSTLAKGSLTYGEFVLPGRERNEVVMFTHVCHPSLANDNVSGMSIATHLAQWLQRSRRRYSYRIVFAPGTIGSLCWLRLNEKRLGRVKHGLVLCLLGDPAPLTYKRSGRGDTEIDAVAQYVLARQRPLPRVIDFEPYGYDERQLCSPGFNLPVGRLTRSVNDGYPEYHSSADNMSLITDAQLEGSLRVCQEIVETLESARIYVNIKPRGEPRLGRRGLYGATGGRSPKAGERALLWVLNQSDGTRSLVNIAQRSGLALATIQEAASALHKAGLLRQVSRRPEAGRRRVKRCKPGRKGTR